MTGDRLNVSFAPSEINTSTGEFNGYGAVFGTLDSHADIIQPGAFRASLADWRLRGRWPRMLLMHGTSINPFSGSDIPVGKWSKMEEDRNGLYVEGRILALETDYGKRILSLMKGGALDGLSIGYRVKRSSPGRGSVARFLEAIDLREVSIVDEPSHDDARIAAVKKPPPQVATDAAFERLKAALKRVAASEAPTADAAYDRLQAALRGL